MEIYILREKDGALLKEKYFRNSRREISSYFFACHSFQFEYSQGAGEAGIVSKDFLYIILILDVFKAVARRQKRQRESTFFRNFFSLPAFSSFLFLDLTARHSFSFRILYCSVLDLAWHGMAESLPSSC